MIPKRSHNNRGYTLSNNKKRKQNSIQASRFISEMDMQPDSQEKNKIDLEAIKPHMQNKKKKTSWTMINLMHEGGTSNQFVSVVVTWITNQLSL